jgi:Protein of unknown function (DUF1189)
MGFIAYIRNAFGKRSGYQASQEMSFVWVCLYTLVWVAILACVQTLVLYGSISSAVVESMPQVAAQFPSGVTLKLSNSRLHIEGNASNAPLTITLPHVVLQANDAISLTTFTPIASPDSNRIEWISDVIVFIKNGSIVETISYPQGTFTITQDSIRTLSASLQKNIPWLVACVGIFIYITYLINLLFFLVCVVLSIRIRSYFSQTKRGYAYATRVALYMAISYSAVMLIGSMFGVGSFAISVLSACLCIWYATK